MNKNYVILVIGLLFLVTIFSGCEQSNRKSEDLFDGSTSSQTSIVTNTAMSTLTPDSIITLATVPTLEIEQARAKLLELLAHNGDCHLPCFWGITPGRSTTNVTENTLKPLLNLSNSNGWDSTSGMITVEYKEEKKFMMPI